MRAFLTIAGRIEVLLPLTYKFMQPLLVTICLHELATSSTVNRPKSKTQ